MKAFVNSRDTLVTEAIDGLLLSSAGKDLVRLDGFPEIKVVLRKSLKKDRVAVISGGGSGHEPAHAGFVGEGMLTAAVCGEMFASPSVDAVLSAIVAVTGEAGCLLIVKNYTGDRLNFGLAAERAKALGYNVQMVFVSDDLALPDLPNPRGIAGTLFVHKIAGASASAGKSLDEVYAAAADAAAHVHSLGLSLTNCFIPGSTARHAELAEDAVELGLGIHGEPGAAIIPYQTADILVKTVADKIDGHLAPDARVALLINSLGGVSPLEMAVVTRALAKTALFEKVEYVFGPGPYMTAVNMQGFSFSVLILNDTRRTALLADTAVGNWPVGHDVSSVPSAHVACPQIAVKGVGSSDEPATRLFITKAVRSLQKHADDIDSLDAKVGDGDTGSTLALAARSIGDHLDELPLADGAALLHAIGERLLRSAGGSSGVLLSILFTAAGQAYVQNGGWVPALLAGIEQMKLYGGARLGDRTMIDALEPALQELAATGSLEKAANAARIGANKTASMTRAGAGRSAYVPEVALKDVADPGAEAVSRLFEDLSGI